MNDHAFRFWIVEWLFGVFLCKFFYWACFKIRQSHALDEVTPSSNTTSELVILLFKRINTMSIKTEMFKNSAVSVGHHIQKMPTSIAA